MEEQEKISMIRRDWRDSSLKPIITLLALILALVLVACTVIALYLIKLYAAYVLYAWLVAIALVPAIGIAFALVALWRYMHKPLVIPVAQHGTIVRIPDGNMQVISGSELFAFETRSATPVMETKVVEERSTYLHDGDAYLSGNVSRETPVYIPVSRPETFPAMEDLSPNPIVQAVDFLQTEEDRAKEVRASNDNSVLIQRIADLHTMGLPLRSIAKIVHMEGRKYTQFKELCIQAGIQNID